ncbi:MAG: hypothetical protein EOO92_24015, partial [Pedobacter sp.]
MSVTATPSGRMHPKSTSIFTFLRQTNRIMRAAFFMLLLSGSIVTHAQPAITKNIGLPSGNANSTGVAFGNGIYVAIL